MLYFQICRKVACIIQSFSDPLPRFTDCWFCSICTVCRGPCFSLFLSLWSEAVVYCCVTYYQKYSGLKPHEVLISSDQKTGMAQLFFASVPLLKSVATGLLGSLRKNLPRSFRLGRIQSLAPRGLMSHSSLSGLSPSNLRSSHSFPCGLPVFKPVTVCPALLTLPFSLKCPSSTNWEGDHPCDNLQVISLIIRSTVPASTTQSLCIIDEWRWGDISSNSQDPGFRLWITGAILRVLLVAGKDEENEALCLWILRTQLSVWGLMGICSEGMFGGGWLKAQWPEQLTWEFRRARSFTLSHQFITIIPWSSRYHSNFKKLRKPKHSETYGKIYPMSHNGQVANPGIKPGLPDSGIQDPSAQIPASTFSLSCLIILVIICSRLFLTLSLEIFSKFVWCQIFLKIHFCPRDMFAKQTISPKKWMPMGRAFRSLSARNAWLLGYYCCPGTTKWWELGPWTGPNPPGQKFLIGVTLAFI